MYNIHKLLIQFFTEDLLSDVAVCYSMKKLDTKNQMSINKTNMLDNENNFLKFPIELYDFLYFNLFGT